MGILRNEHGMEEKEAEAYYEAEKRKNNLGFMGIGALFILAGLLLFGFSVFYRVRNSEINRGIESTGIVTRMVTDSSGEGAGRIIYGYRHTFTYEINGESYKKSSRSNADISYSKDVDIPIMISRDHPQWAEVLNTNTGKVYSDPPGFGVAFLLIVAGSIALAVIRYTNKEATGPKE